MKLKLLTALLAVTLLLASVLTVTADNETPEGGEATPTTTTTTTVTTTTTTTEAPDGGEGEATTTTTTTTTAATTTTTTEAPDGGEGEATTTTTATTLGATTTTAATTTAGGTTVSTQAGGTTAPSATTATGGTTTTGSTATTVTTTTTIPTLPPFVDTDLVERLELVTEPDVDHSYLHYYHGEQQVTSSAFGWVPGKDGYAMILDGESHLRFVPETFETLDAFTLTAFVNWQGGSSGQKLFYISQNDYLYLKVSPYVNDEEKRIDGFYVEWQGSDMTPVTLYKPVGGDTSFRPKENEWYHLAIVVAPGELTLYVNGTPYLSHETTLNPSELQFSRFLIGGGVYGDPLLNAYIDEVYLYPEALQREHIALLSAGIDPTVGGNLPTMDTYRPTAPSTSTTKKYVTTAPTVAKDEKSSTVFGLPKAMVVIPGCVLLAVVVLSILLSVKKPDETEEESATALGEPEIPEDDEEEGTPFIPTEIPTEETPDPSDDVPTDGSEEEQV